MNHILWTCTALAVLASLAKDRQRTARALKGAAKRLWKIAPLFLLVMALYALTMTLVPPTVIQKNIGQESGLRGLLIAIGLGSSAMTPGFVAYPLCAALREQGVPLFILGAFSLALMNIGVATYPLEKRYLGWKVALGRNVFGLLITLAVAFAMLFIFGETF